MNIVHKLLYTSTCLLLVRQTHIIATATGSQLSNNPSDSAKSCTASTSYKQFGKMSDGNDFKYETGTSSVAFVTAPDDKVAKKLAHGLVEQKLAACVNIIPSIQSIYMWEGKVNEDNEYLMMIKTQTNRIEDLTKWVRDNHPYSVAEVITLPIEQGNIPYMKWLSETVENKK